ncbi:hypothetical protein ACW5WG_14415, partial [Aeromonas salmonicida]
ADLRGMVVLRSLGFQLVPFKLHRFRKQRRAAPVRASGSAPLPVACLPSAASGSARWRVTR